MHRHSLSARAPHWGAVAKLPIKTTLPRRTFALASRSLARGSDADDQRTRPCSRVPNSDKKTGPFIDQVHSETSAHGPLRNSAALQKSVEIGGNPTWPAP